MQRCKNCGAIIDGRHICGPTYEELTDFVRDVRRHTIDLPDAYRATHSQLAFIVGWLHDKASLYVGEWKIMPVNLDLTGNEPMLSQNDQPD